MTTTTGDMVAYLKDRARQHKTRAREADRRVDELEAPVIDAAHALADHVNGTTP